MVSGSQAGPFHYQYDSCRTPFRIALDWCWFGEHARARLPDEDQQLLQRHRRRQHRRRLRAERQQAACSSRPPPARRRWRSSRRPSSARRASARWSARPTRRSSTRATRASRPCRRYVGGAYYDESWAVMSLLMMTGNMLNYRHPRSARADFAGHGRWLDHRRAVPATRLAWPPCRTRPTGIDAPALSHPSPRPRRCAIERPGAGDSAA